MAWEALAQLGISAYSDWQSDQLTAKQAKAQIGSIDEMLKNLARQQEELANAYNVRKQIATDIYGNKVENVTYKARRGLESLGKEYGAGTAQTGLAFSGTLYDKAKEGEQGIKYDLTSNKRDLENKLGQTLADIMIKETGDYANIQNTMAQLRGQKDVLGNVVEENEDTFMERLIDPLNTGWFEGYSKEDVHKDFLTGGGLHAYNTIKGWFS